MSRWVLMIIGAFFGGMVGNGLGFIIGGALGFWLGGLFNADVDADGQDLSDDLRELLNDKALNTGQTQPNTEGLPRTQARTLLRGPYLDLLIAIMHSDDELYQEELDAIVRIFRIMDFSKKEMEILQQDVQQRLHHPTDPHLSCQRLQPLSLNEKTLLMEGFYRVAYADDEFHPKEFELIQTIGASLGIQELWHVVQSIAGRCQFHKGFNKTLQPGQQNVPTLLGLPHDASLKELRARHQQLLSFYKKIKLPNLKAELHNFCQVAISELNKVNSLLKEMASPEQKPHHTNSTPKKVQPQAPPMPGPRKTNTPAYGSKTPARAKPKKSTAPTKTSTPPKYSPTNLPNPVLLDGLNPQQALAQLWGPTITNSPIGQKIQPTPFQEAQDAITISADLVEFLSQSNQFKQIEHQTDEERILMLGDFDPQTRKYAVQSFVKEGPQAIEKLLPHMSNFLARTGIVEVLRAFGDAALPKLQEALNAADEFDKDWLLPLFVDIATQRAQPLLASYLKSDNVLLNYRAKQELSRIGYSQDQIAQMA